MLMNFSLCQAKYFSNRKIYSPNKKYYALITTYHFNAKNRIKRKSENFSSGRNPLDSKNITSYESKIEFFSSKHKLLASKSFISFDHEHGIIF